MASPRLVKTSVSVSADDLDRARELGINVSELVRAALRRRLAEEDLERDVDGYRLAFEEWDESGWDHLAAEGQ
jgi:post-segregation antitoxin (ccd killing protein)